MNEDWGVIQKFILEADTETALLNAINILMTDHTHLVGFSEAVANGIPVLAVHWYNAPGINKFIVVATTGEHIVDALLVWVKDKCKSENVKQPDIDGSLRAGYRVCTYIEDYYHNISNVAFYIQPKWIEYHK